MLQLMMQLVLVSLPALCHACSYTCLYSCIGRARCLLLSVFKQFFQCLCLCCVSMEVRAHARTLSQLLTYSISFDCMLAGIMNVVYVRYTSCTACNVIVALPIFSLIPPPAPFQNAHADHNPLSKSKLWT